MMKSNYLRRNFLLKGAELIDVRARTSTWLKPGGTDQYFEDIDMITNLYKQVCTLWSLKLRIDVTLRHFLVSK